MFNTKNPYFPGNNIPLKACSAALDFAICGFPTHPVTFISSNS